MNLNSYSRSVRTNPMLLYKQPALHRFFAWLGPILVALAIALFIVYGVKSDAAGQTDEQIDDTFGYLTGAFFAIFIGAGFVTMAIQSCIVVRSFSFIMFPCCLNSEKLQKIEADCTARSPNLAIVNGVPIMVSHNQAPQQGSYQEKKIQRLGVQMVYVDQPSVPSMQAVAAPQLTMASMAVVPETRETTVITVPEGAV
ncbi:Hypothetical_protein [Hexamita inflata]|uniref:Hypothetical_protein n=1 Tax=Hexamita inflata TaxID=28002 RepID=A0AA86VQT7_9EUKA|nr:Hypothetical protein HINF_LOCUS61593 [Hexamita inflata]